MPTKCLNLIIAAAAANGELAAAGPAPDANPQQDPAAANNAGLSATAGQSATRPPHSKADIHNRAATRNREAIHSRAVTSPGEAAVPESAVFAESALPSATPRISQPRGPVTIQPGMLLQVRTSEPVDSKRAKDGEPVQFTVIQDVAVGGVLAIPRGATATAL